MRVNGLVVAGVVTASMSLVWFTTSLSGPWTHPLVGWVPMYLSSALAGVACLRAGSLPGLGVPGRRFWRQMGTVMLLLGVATVSNTVDAVGDRVLRQEVSTPTLAIYAAGVLVALWSLIRLPAAGSAPPGRWSRFVLDAGTVVLTAGLFAWYFSFRHTEDWAVATGSALAVFCVMLAGFVGVLAFVKLALVGQSSVDRVALKILAGATLAGTLGGALAPLLAASPHLNVAQLTLPVAAAVVTAAADRQRRAMSQPPPPAPRRRPFSVVPYLAIAATDTLLLVTSASTPVTLIVAATAVVLTLVVVLRQLHSFRDNAELLGRIDASVRELRLVQAQLAHEASHDGLTGLANRALFEEISRRALATGHCHLALVDLDDFKVINDRMGHHVGDVLLIAVGKRLRDCVRSGDTVARLGGDEFALLIHGSADQVTAVVERASRALGRPTHVAGQDLLVQASIGLADGEHIREPKELLRRADVAMYTAKSLGKGRHARYDADLDRSDAEFVQLVTELRQGLVRGEFHMVYQPVVRLPDGETVGAEALVRWRHPTRGLVPPDVFIPVAERTGVIVALGDWILRSVCHQAAEWLREGPAGAPWRISVNVSARQLREPGFADSVDTALRDSGLPAGRLLIEVTETAVFDGGPAVEALATIAHSGVTVALDDFGTGHSSLGLLRTCPVGIIKLDKSFVDGITRGTEEAVIATAVIQIANGLGLDAIAEGVETRHQAVRLYEMGYRMAQGYHFARPMPASEIAPLLHAGDGVTAGT